MLPETSVQTVPKRLASWIWWKGRQKAYPEAFGKFIVGKGTTNEFVKTFGERCPFCNGFRHATDPESGNMYYCLCSITTWLDEKHSRLQMVETHSTPAALSQIAPLTEYPGAKELSNLLKEIKEWLIKPDHWFLISGGFGCGKTHILRAIKTIYGSLAFYISAEDLNSAIFRGLKEKDLDELVIELASAPVLLIDDLGIEHSNKMFTDTFAQIVNRRYNAGPEDYPMIVTTNLSPTDLVKSPDLATGRLASRLVDERYSRVHKLLQPDYRLKTTKKG